MTVSDVNVNLKRKARESEREQNGANCAEYHATFPSEHLRDL